MIARKRKKVGSHSTITKHIGTVLLCLECRRDVPAGNRLAEGAKQSKCVIGSVPMTRGGRLCRNRGAKRGGGGLHPPLWGTFPMKPTNRRFVGFAKGETDFDKSKIWQNHRGRLLETDAQLGMPAIPRQRRATTTHRRGKHRRRGALRAPAICLTWDKRTVPLSHTDSRAQPAGERGSRYRMKIGKRRLSTASRQRCP